MRTKLRRPVSAAARASALLVASCALVGCVMRSVSPIVAEKDREFDARLVGSWRGDGKESAVITATGSEYLIAYTDDGGKAGRFRGRLGRLGAYRVLDLAPEAVPADASDSYAALVLPLHTFLVIDSIGAEVRARGIQPDSVKAYLEREPTAVAHLKLNDDVVLTAPTAELRAFLARFTARPGILDGGSAWKRL